MVVWTHTRFISFTLMNHKVSTDQPKGSGFDSGSFCAESACSAHVCDSFSWFPVTVQKHAHYFDERLHSILWCDWLTDWLVCPVNWWPVQGVFLTLIMCLIKYGLADWCMDSTTFYFKPHLKHFKAQSYLFCLNVMQIQLNHLYF